MANQFLKLIINVFRANKNLPLQLQEFGNKYAKNEFKSLKNFDQKQAYQFCSEWNVKLIFISVIFNQAYIQIVSDFKNYAKNIQENFDISKLSTEQKKKFNDLKTKLEKLF